MHTRLTHFANVRIGQEFISLATGRLYRRMRQDRRRGYNATAVNERRFSQFGANQVVKAISKAKEAKR